MREAVAMQKLLIWLYFSYKYLKFNETLTKDVVSFEQPAPDVNKDQQDSSLPTLYTFIGQYRLQETRDILR